MSGNIKVIKTGNNYEQINKSIIYDKAIDTTTLGFFCRVITLSEKWQLNITGLTTILKMSREKVQKCIKQLEERGYLKREKVQGKNGQFCGWDYAFFNMSNVIAGDGENRQPENTDIGENRLSENPSVYIETGNNIETNNSNIERKIYKEEIVKEEYDLSFVSDEFRPAVNKWLEYKKERRERYKSTSSVKVFYNNLLKYSGNNPAKALEVVDQSIGNNYSGIFELKTKNASSFNGTTPTNGRASSRVPVGKKRVYTSTI